MILLFRKISQKLLRENKVGTPALPEGRYLKYAIGEILLLGKQSPARDLIWVEQTISQTSSVPLGTGYVGIPTEDINHIAYLRHAIPDYISVFYRYFVPTGQ